jgi:DNA polymerase III alpha subunit (gram-positive type)
MLSHSLAFIDIETTGISRDTGEIIELAAVITKMKDGELTVVDQVDIKIKPKHIETADPQALRINGYNEADWLFAIDLEEAMKVFAEKTKGCIFVAHNVTFDYAFIEKAFIDVELENQMHFHKLDTISIAFAVLNANEDINRYSLHALAEYYQIENKKAHSAFADAYATYEVFKKLMNLK